MNDPAEPAEKKPPRARKNWRAVLRTIHRDFGFFAVGLTLIYATSGVAVNHINDWNPSFKEYQRSLTLAGPLPEDDGEAASLVLDALEIEEEPADVFGRRETLVRYDVKTPDAEVEVRTDEGEVHVTRGRETEVFELDESLPPGDWAAAVAGLRVAGIKGEPVSVHRVDIPTRELTVSFERRTVIVNDLGDEADVFEQGEKPRFFLYVANWLHLNRGKKGWTIIADFYAVVLLVLAFSGMLMVRGKQGLFGRGGVFLLIGLAVPVIYIIVAGP